MTNTALEVDCTQYMVDVLFAAMSPATRICTELPNTLVAALPVIQVIRTGGPNDGVVLDIPTFALHAFAATQTAANQQLYTAFSVLLAARGRVVTGTGWRAVLTRVRLLGGPSWAPYENTDVRHAVSIVQPRIKIT